MSWWVLILVIGGEPIAVPGHFETQAQCFQASVHASRGVYSRGDDWQTMGFSKRYAEAICIPIDERWKVPFRSPFEDSE